MAEPSVIFSTVRGLQRIVLNRPATLNALSLDMVRVMTAGLQRLQLASKESTLPQPAAVLISGAGGRAFCAGGDVKSLWAARAPGGVSADQLAFFREEYALDDALAVDNITRAPHVVIYDGAVMGGGAGISIHASVRVATESTVFAMPETLIGFFPDVGGSYFLPRITGRIGTYLALTGARLRGADAVHAGVATHFVPRAALPALIAALEDQPPPPPHLSIDERTANVTALVNHFAVPPPTPFSLGGDIGIALRDAFDPAYCSADVAAALKSAASSRSSAVSDFATSATAALLRGSPTSVSVTIEQLRRGAQPSMTLKSCLRMELGLATKFAAERDFYEGVRSVLVDKEVGVQPAWDAPPSAETVNKYFAPLSPGVEDLQFFA